MHALRERVRAGGDEGAATTELVILTPLLMLLVTLIFQVGLWFHALNVAQAAAQEGARAARVEGGTAADGEARAHDLLAELGPRLVVLDGAGVSASRHTESARVEIRGHAIEVMPLLRFPIHVVSEGPVERFREP